MSEGTFSDVKAHMYVMTVFLNAGVVDLQAKVSLPEEIHLTETVEGLLQEEVYLLSLLMTPFQLLSYV